MSLLDAELQALRRECHAKECHPWFEYTLTHGPRKGFDSSVPPESPELTQGRAAEWFKNSDKGRDGWERFDYHEEAYWRRLTFAGYMLAVSLLETDSSKCIACGGTGYSPEYCCSGYEGGVPSCGCQGLPVDYLPCERGCAAVELPR